jgi:general secretion pathway protein K
MRKLQIQCARERGFALLVVLWTLALLALLGTQLVGTGRGELLLARNLIDAANVQAAADGAVQEAIFRLLDRSDRHWAADGLPRTVQLGAAEVIVRIENESHKINPNIAAEPLLTALLLRVDVAPSNASASAIAAAILDWRTASSQPRPHGAKAPQYAAAGLDYGPPGSEFRSIDELGAVLGMRPALLAALRPHMTIFSDSDPDGSTADPVVLAALADAGDLTPASPVAMPVASIVARAQGRNHASYAERAVVRLNATAGDRPYELLAFERLDSMQVGVAH